MSVDRLLRRLHLGPKEVSTTDRSFDPFRPIDERAPSRKNMD